MATHRLRVDWPVCQARGLCFEMLPEAIELDDWGYPVVTGEITPELIAAARAAVRACPRMALRLGKVVRSDQVGRDVGT